MEKKKFEKPKNAAAAAASSDEIFKIPKITREPANKQMKLGQKLILRVEAQGVPSPTYQWYQNGIKIPGAVMNSLVIVKTRGNNGGAYTCEAKNFVGSVMSKSAMISFFSSDKLPNLKIQPESLSIAAGKSCKFTLVDVKDEELKGVSLQWFFNGRKISGVTSRTLEFTETKKKYEGEYKLIASKNSAMVASNSVRLLVQEAGQKESIHFDREELSLADVLLTQEMPSLKMMEASMPSIKLPPVPSFAKAEGDALLESLAGEDSFYEPEDAEEELFFSPDEEELSDESDSSSDHLYEALQQEEVVLEKKSPIVVVQSQAQEASLDAPVSEVEPAPVVTAIEAEISEPILKAVVEESPTTSHSDLAPVAEIIQSKAPLDEKVREQLMAKKDFLERLLQSVATMKQRERAAPTIQENPLAQKIARQKIFLLKLRENVLAKKKEAA